MFMLESLRLNTATLSLSTICAGKLFQTLILRQTKEFRRQFILECSLNILKLLRECWVCARAAHKENSNPNPNSHVHCLLLKWNSLPADVVNISWQRLSRRILVDTRSLFQLWSPVWFMNLCQLSCWWSGYTGSTAFVQYLLAFAWSR